jgi:hypothetical protein
MLLKETIPVCTENYKIPAYKSAVLLVVKALLYIVNKRFKWLIFIIIYHFLFKRLRLTFQSQHNNIFCRPRVCIYKSAEILADSVLEREKKLNVK